MLALLQAKPKLLMGGMVAAAVLAAALGVACIVEALRLEAERAAHAETRTALERESSKAREAVAQNQALQRSIATQNQAVATIAARGEAREAKARVVVREVLAKPAPAPSGAGPEILNEFMGGVFAR